MAPVPARPAAGVAGAGSGIPLAGWRQLSRRSMVVRPLTDLVRLLPLVAGLLILHSRTGSGLLWGVAASVFAVVTGLVHWATTRYLVTDERVYLRRGLLNQKILSVARDRIRTVDVTAHLLHRLLGVCRVSIGTGRNDLRSSENFHLDVVTRAEAESLRLVLLSGARELTADEEEAVPAGSPEPPAGSEPLARPAPAHGDQPGLAERTNELVRLRVSWLRFAPLTMTGLVVLGVLFGAILQITNATDVNLAATGPVRRVVADFAAFSVLQRILVGGAVVIAGYVLIAMAGYIAVFWNFRLAEYGADTLRVTRGLLSIRATTISLQPAARGRDQRAATAASRPGSPVHRHHHRPARGPRGRARRLGAGAAGAAGRRPPSGRRRARTA